jgi:LEA14-like dessication related protein
MKQIQIILLSLIAGIALSSCSVEDPQFRGIENIQVLDASRKAIKVRAEARMFNPNGFNITIQEANVAVQVNGINIGEVTETEEKVVDSKSEFVIPFVISVPVSAISDNPLSGLFNLAMGKPIEVKYNGFVKAKALGISKKVNLDDTKQLSLKDIKL